MSCLPIYLLSFSLFFVCTRLPCRFMQAKGIYRVTDKSQESEGGIGGSSFEAQIIRNGTAMPSRY